VTRNKIEAEISLMAESDFNRQLNTLTKLTVKAIEYPISITVKNTDNRG
jgi:hypothetical protein